MYNAKILQKIKNFPEHCNRICWNSFSFFSYICIVKYTYRASFVVLLFRQLSSLVNINLISNSFYAQLWHCSWTVRILMVYGMVPNIKCRLTFQRHFNKQRNLYIIFKARGKHFVKLFRKKIVVMVFWILFLLFRNYSYEFSRFLYTCEDWWQIYATDQLWSI